MSLITVKTQLKNALDNVSGLHTTYDHQAVELEGGGTPAAIMMFGDSSEQIENNAENILEVVCVIRVIVQNTSNTSIQMTELLSTVDEILDEIRKNEYWRLGGAHYFMPEDISPVAFGNMGNLQVMYMDIKTVTKFLKSTEL